MDYPTPPDDVPERGSESPFSHAKLIKEGGKYACCEAPNLIGWRDQIDQIFWVEISTASMRSARREWYGPFGLESSPIGPTGTLGNRKRTTAKLGPTVAKVTPPLKNFSMTNEVEPCVLAATQRNYRFVATTAVAATIEDGVVAAKLTAATTDETFDACVVKSVGRLRFRKGTNGTLRYPIVATRR